MEVVVLYSSPTVLPNVVLVRVVQTLLQQYATLQTYCTDTATTGDVCPDTFSYSLDKICDVAVQSWSGRLSRIAMHPMGDSMWIVFHCA